MTPALPRGPAYVYPAAGGPTGSPVTGWRLVRTVAAVTTVGGRPEFWWSVVWWHPACDDPDRDLDEIVMAHGRTPHREAAVARGREAKAAARAAGPPPEVSP